MFMLFKLANVKLQYIITKKEALAIVKYLVECC